MRRLLAPLGLLCCLGLGPPSCGRSNPDYCGPDTPCAGGFHCVPSANLNTGEGTCVALGDLSMVCTDSTQCSDATPLCDALIGVCRGCQVGEDAQCAARSASTPRCAGGQCVQCALPSGTTKAAQVPECTALGVTTPVCDQNQCRGCLRHDECQSGVCIKADSADIAKPYSLAVGTCVPVEQVLAVSSVACSPDGPVYCRPQDAVNHLGQVVNGATVYRYIVFKSGGQPADFSEIQIGTSTQQALLGLELHFISAATADDPATQMDATRAVGIGGAQQRGFVVQSNVHLLLEGFYIHDNTVGVDCSAIGAVPGTTARVRLLRSWLTRNNTALSAEAGCILQVDRSLVGAQSGGDSMGNLGGVATINRSDFIFTNSVFANNGDPNQIATTGFGGIKIYGSLAGNVTSQIVSSLFYQNSVSLAKGTMRASTVWCDAPLDKPVVLFDSLFLQGMYLKGTVAVTPECGPSTVLPASHLLTDDSVLAMAAGTTAIMASDLGAGWAMDFVPRGTPGNPAQQALQQGGAAALTLQIGSNAVTIDAPTVDMKGLARPSGGKIAIGPLEAQP